MLRRLLGQTVIYTAANILARGTVVISLLVLPLFLTTAEYGAFGMILAVAALVNQTVPLEITQGLVRYFGPASPSDRIAFAASAWWFTVATLFGAGLIALLLARPLCQLMFGDLAYLDVFRLAVGLFILNALFFFVQNQFRWEFRTRPYVWVTLTQAFAVLGLSIAFAATFEAPLDGVVLGQIAGTALGVGLALLGLRRSLSGSFGVDKLKAMLALSLPLVPASLAVYASTYSSRLILNGMADLSDVGIYTFASQIAGIPAIIILGVQGALIPMVMAHHESPETPSAVARLFEAFTGVAIGLSLAIGLFAPELILYFGDPDYLSAAPLVILLAPAYLLLQMYIFFPGFLVGKRTDLQMWVSVASGLICIGFSFWFIASWGSVGAAIASLVSAAAFLLLWFALSRPLYPIPIRWGRVSLVVVVAIVAATIGSRLDPGAILLSASVKLLLLLGVAAAVFAFDLIPIRHSREVILATLRRLSAEPR